MKPQFETAKAKLSVKPVFVRIGRDSNRCNRGEELGWIENQDEYQELIKTLTSQVAEEVKLLPPIFVAHNRESRIDDEMLDTIGEDAPSVDLYLFVMNNGHGFDIAVAFAQRYKKPIMLTTLALFDPIASAPFLAITENARPHLRLVSAAR